METEKLEHLIGNQQLRAHRYGTHVTNTILKLLKRSDDRLTLQIYELLEGLTAKERADLLANNFKAKRLAKLRESIKEIESEVVKVTSTVLGDEGKKYAAYEMGRAQELAFAMGVEDLGTKISTNQVYAAAMARPMNGKHIRDHVKDLATAHRKEIFGAINIGFVNGESLSAIMSSIRGTAAAKRADGLLYKRNGKIENLIVRSSLAHISSVATVESFKQLEVKEYYLSPVFDGRTSHICRSLNAEGITYYKVGKGILPPLHPGGCRTTVLARTESAEAIRKPFVRDDRPVSKIPESERGEKIGTTNAPSFDAWLRRQPKSTQREWLGETRYKLFNNGVKLNKFADPKKGAYNLAEIERMNSEAFAKIAD